MKRGLLLAVLVAMASLAGAADEALGAGLIIDHKCVELSPIALEDVAAASSLRALMRHASVGTGIDWGLDCFAGAHPTNVSCSGYPAGVYDRSRWVLELRGGNWKDKVDDLVTQVELRTADFDVFMTKFCYIDALGDSHPDWEYFRAAMEQLEADYPDKRFVWWTIPLTRDGQAGTDIFNDIMREYCRAQGKVLFDIADIECHEPNGVKLTNAGGDEIISALYTNETHAGHLNVEGRIRVAGAFWQMMARLAGWTRTITVDDDGPADFNNIQAAIDAASHFDTILAADGTYSGPGNRNIEFAGKAITLRSENGPLVTIIDCENKGHGVYVVDNDTAEAQLEGFTITNTYHGAIKIYSSSPPRMASSGVGADGDGPYRPGYEDVVVSNCIIAGNTDAGILLDGHDNATIAGCRISGNAGGGVWSYMSWPTFRNCAVVGNEQTGIRATGATVTSCTVADNTAFGIWMYEPTVSNSIVWGNGLGQIHDPAVDAAEVTYCCVEGRFEGPGNIDADPCFADPNSGDYHLKSQAGRWEPNSGSWVYDDVTSPCIDAGNPGSPLGDEPNDAPNVRINMGAYGGTPEASRTPAGWGVLADLTNDWIVDFEDFAFQAADWKKNESEQPGDLNRDGVVGAADTALLADGWLIERRHIPPDMVFIPAGEFMMGDSFGEGNSDERPVHTVAVDSFYMGKYEITNGQYCDYLNSAISQGLIAVTSGHVYKAGSGTSSLYCDTHSADTGSQIDHSGGVFTVRTKGGRDMSTDPMVIVTWYGTVAYCNWRSQQEGYQQCYDLSTWDCDFSKKSYRLPTKAEWEYAARAGLAGRRFPWGDTIFRQRGKLLQPPLRRIL